MAPIFVLSARSAWNRRATLLLTVFAIALSVLLLLGVERLRHAARSGFSQALSGTDLVVGARASPLQLMLYSVFRLGEPTNNLSWKNAQDIAANPAVAWTIPLSLGDSHHGFPVLATNADYFRHYRYSGNRPLTLRSGQVLADLFDVVIGAEVANQLGYRIGQNIVLAHGLDQNVGVEHADKPFTVTGILAPTHSPVDRTLHIGLAAMEAMHLDWQGGAPLPGYRIPADVVKKFDLTPHSITALLVGLKNRSAVFRLQRRINEHQPEALSAVLPGMALDELWQVTETAERALLAISALVAVVSLAGMVAVILASMNERRRELAILRSLGAGPRHILCLLLLEGLLVTTVGVICGVVALLLLQPLIGPWASAQFGVDLAFAWPTRTEWFWLLAVLGAGMLASLLPAWRACRLSLADGLTPRILLKNNEKMYLDFRPCRPSLPADRRILLAIARTDHRTAG